jgi:hypothetical protein
VDLASQLLPIDDTPRLMRPSDVLLLAAAAYAAGGSHERRRCVDLVIEEREGWRGEPSDLTIGELCGVLCAAIDAAE